MARLAYSFGDWRDEQLRSELSNLHQLEGKSGHRWNYELQWNRLLLPYRYKPLQAEFHRNRGNRCCDLPILQYTRRRLQTFLRPKS